MVLLEGKFGFRGEPKWKRGDLDSHFRLGKALEDAASIAQSCVPFGISCEFPDITWDNTLFKSLAQSEKMWYFFDYALRLQQHYVIFMAVMAPFCRVKTSTPLEGGYRLDMHIEDRHYHCTYLNDHVCCMVWVVGKIIHHVHTKNNQTI